MEKLTLLSHINLLFELPKEDMELIDRNSTVTPIRKGIQIPIPEQPLDMLFFLKKGQVRLYPMTPHGKQLTTDIIVDGNMLEETQFFMMKDKQTYA